jgi:IclR family acetate operon transcriptional repressor
MEPIASAELATTSGITGARLQRGLNALIDAGLISRDAEHTYALAAKSIHLAALIRNNAPRSRIAMPVLEVLAAETGETATFNAYFPSTGDVMIDAVAEGRQSLRYALEPGEAVPLHAGAAGKAILAFLPLVEIARVLSRSSLAAMTHHTVTDREELDRHLDVIRKDGCAVARGERLAGAVEFAAPVFDAPSRVVGSLVITAPENRLSPCLVDRCRRAVRHHAAHMSVLLGWIDQPSATEPRRSESTP